MVELSGSRYIAWNRARLGLIAVQQVREGRRSNKYRYITLDRVP